MRDSEGFLLPSGNEGPRMGEKGRVTRTLTAWCGDCAWWEHATENLTPREAALEWKGRGWALTRAFGWLCPSCAAARGLGTLGGHSDGAS
jgi:hypothetical protein